MSIEPLQHVGNELFLRNMRALWRTDPQLALRIDIIDDKERLPLEPARSGAWTAKVSTANDKSVYLHSRVDPLAEAACLADWVKTQDVFCVVVCGLGLGYHVRTLLDRLPDEAFVLCIEPSLRVISTALCCVDLAEPIEKRRLLILTDDEKVRLHHLLSPVSTLMMLGTEFLRHGPSLQAQEKAYGAVTQAVTDFVAFSRMSLLTLVANSRQTCKNVAMNLVHYVTTPPIDALKDRFAGEPAVIVSAGPSLRRNIDQLAELSGKAVLIAVQTVLKPLIARGIRPDFVTTLDFHEVSRQFFDGLGDLPQCHLIAEPKATWHVLDHYPGPMSLLGNGWAQLVLGDALGGRATLPAGATVAHLAFYLAVFLGCDPIIFVGQDLAFTGHVFYAPGVEIHRTWRSELNRFHTIEQKEWDRIARNRPILRKIPGAGGQELYTDELLFTYLEQFEKDIAATSREIINATEGGARIRGTVNQTLAETSRRFSDHRIDPDRFAYRDRMKWRDPERLPDATRQLEQRLLELAEAREVCAELLRLLDELNGLTEDAARFNQRLVRVDELRARIAQDTRAYRIINAATQLAELRRYSADRRLGSEDIDEPTRARRQITRDIEFVSAVREGATDVEAMLRAAMERITHPIRGL